MRPQGDFAAQRALFQLPSSAGLGETLEPGHPRPQSAGAGRRGPRALVRYGQATVLRQPQSWRVRAWDRVQQNAPKKKQGGKLNTHREYIYILIFIYSFFNIYIKKVSTRLGYIYKTYPKRVETFLMMLVRARIAFASLAREVRG